MERLKSGGRSADDGGNEGSQGSEGRLPLRKALLRYQTASNSVLSGLQPAGSKAHCPKPWVQAMS